LGQAASTHSNQAEKPFIRLKHHPSTRLPNHRYKTLKRKSPKMRGLEKTPDRHPPRRHQQIGTLDQKTPSIVKSLEQSPDNPHRIRHMLNEMKRQNHVEPFAKRKRNRVGTNDINAITSTSKNSFTRRRL
jgi:hypothetical protein